MRVNLADDNDMEVQMAPLIDCVFLLLIFFLVATTLKKQENELPLELPAAAASVSAPRTDNLLIVSVDASGGIYLGSTPATKTMLHERLAEAGKVNPGQPVRIDGDRAAPFEAIVHVLDICDFEGLTNVKIKTRPGSGSK